ncbi:MAG TPA: hypothetical protein DCZ01_02935 [Elusimicrobia bacterium]|nr:MAG: hypothetical protein A2X37_05570 [Elusimicrobia bacterium GWA2_66_18]HAZ07486.1 hypothetical protein [Elusimicrobiota bacterium]
MTRKLLVVDDDPALCQMLRRILGSVGEVLTATNGVDALRLLEAEKPSLMLLDVVMPEMGGLEVLRAARRLDKGLVVLMLTGSSDLAIAKRALEEGASAYFTKPFEREVLCAEVGRLMGLPEGDASGRPWRVRP